MEIKIEKENENVLLNRTEIYARIYFSGPTPKRPEVKKEIAAKKEVPLDLVVIETMNQEFGKPEAAAYIKVYKTKDAMKIEKPYKTKRDEPKGDANSPAAK